MKSVLVLFVGLLLFVLITAQPVFAGAGNRLGTGGADELLIPVGTRDLAMGGSTLATTAGIDALFWNPAGIAKMKNSATLYVSHMSYIADIGVDYGAVAANLDVIGVLALNVKSLSMGDIIETTTASPDGTGRTFSPQYFTVGLTYSRQLSDRIAVGVTGNLVSERISDVSATGVAFNIGVIYDNLGEVPGLSIGVVAKNLGPEMKYDGSSLYTLATVAGISRGPTYYKIDTAPFELPSTLELGVGYKRTFEGENNMLISASFQHNNFLDDEYKIGAEYSYQDIVFLRGGYDFNQQENATLDYIYGATFGGGLHYTVGATDVTFDYAFRSTKFFNNNHVFSVKLGF